MNTTQESNTTAVATQGSAPAPFMVELKSKATGKTLGERYTFAGRHSAKDLREKFKSSGIKGTELTKAVNSALTGEKDVRVIVGQGMMATLIQDGFIPDFCDKKAKSAVFRFVKPVEPKATVSKLSKDIAAMKDDITPEERAKLIALLNGDTAAVAGK